MPSNNELTTLHLLEWLKCLNACHFNSRLRVRNAVVVSCCFQINCLPLLSQLNICSFKCFRKTKIPFIVILGNMKVFLSFQTEIASSAFKTQITVKKVEVSGKGSLKIARPAFLNPLLFKAGPSHCFFSPQDSQIVQRADLCKTPQLLQSKK